MAAAIHHLPTYRALKPGSRELRLVTLLSKPTVKSSGPWLTNSIRCEMTYTSLDQRPTYYALSHTCVPRKRNTHKICVDGVEIPVTENLYEFLRSVGAHQWATGTFTFWLDTICINQADTRERNHQVSMMRDIYCCAEATLSWLGPYDDQIQRFFTGIKAACKKGVSQHYEDYDYFESHSQELWNRFHRVLQCPYWTRVWILQEVALAKEVYLFCGDVFVTWSEMDRFIGVVQSWEKDKGYRLKGFDTWLALDELRKIGPTTKIWLLLEMFSSANCEDPRDHVYGLLPMAEKLAREEIIVDYWSSATSVFDSVSRYCHKAQPLSTPGHDLITTLERLAIRMGLRSGFKLFRSPHEGHRPYRKRQFWRWTNRRASRSRDSSGTSTPRVTSGIRSPFTRIFSLSSSAASSTVGLNQGEYSPSASLEPSSSSSAATRSGVVKTTAARYSSFSPLRKPLFIELWSSMHEWHATTSSGTIMLFYEQLAYKYGRRVRR